jgi:hypothetical protein
LLVQHHALRLEEIILKLCRNDVEGFEVSSSNHDQTVRQENAVVIEENKAKNSTLSIRKQANQGIYRKYSRIRALAIRNFLTLVRSPMYINKHNLFNCSLYSYKNVLFC